MNTGSRVTVVIPAYKAAATIRRAVDSVLAQRDVDQEIIVVVDGVFDRTSEILSAYDSDHVRVVVNEDNMGVTYTRNRGLELARGEYVLFLDSDDFMEGPLLAGLVRSMGNKDADLGLGPLQVLHAADGKRLPLIVREFASPADLFYRWLAVGETLPPCVTMWRTSFLRHIGGWDESVKRNEDGELVLRAIMIGANFTISAEGRGIYVQHDSPDRLTKRTDILDSRLAVGEMILARQTPVIPKEAKMKAVARYFYRVALNCYSKGVVDLGDKALSRARELGFSGHMGPLWHQIPTRLLGVRLRYRLTNFVKRHRIFGFEGL